MKKNANAIALMLLIMPLAGCLGNDEPRIGCPDNPPDGAVCAVEDYDYMMTAIGADFSGMDLRDGNFTGAMLIYSNFSGADLEGADFEGANVRGADFSGADISGASFGRAIYDSETIWEGVVGQGWGLIFFGPGAELDGVKLDNKFALSWTPAITVEGVDLPKVEPIDLSGSSLVGASIRESTIWIADFSGSDLTTANLFGSEFLLTDFSNASLAGANLSEAYLQWADLTGADLTDAELFDTSIRYLRGCPSQLPEGWRCVSPEVPLEFSHCPTEDEWYASEWEDYLDVLDMSNCNHHLIGPTADLNAAWVDGVNLSGVDLSERPLTYFSAVNLTGCPSELYEGYVCTGGAIFGPQVRLVEADLSGINLSGVDLSGAILIGVNLSGADLSGADLSGAMITGSNLSNANLNGADLSNALLSGADLSNADLSNADLSNANLADLSSADLNGADLSNALLSGANLTGADLSNADLSNADLSGTIWYGTICPDGTNSDDNGNTCENNL